MSAARRDAAMKDFYALIDRLNAAAPDERQAVKDEVWRRFGVEMTVLCLDMSQFSLSVRRRGIVSYLGQIRRMQVLTGPLVREAGGMVVKYAGDNLLAVFGEARSGVEAAVGINRALREAPAPPGMEAVLVSIGMDCGRFLLIPGKDCFGDPVNVAYKLGEDLARPSEILVTAAVSERLGVDWRARLTEQRASLSGLEIVAFSVGY